MSGPGEASVVIPCHDLGRFLPEAVASVRAQTRPALEMLVVDDHSTSPLTRRILSDLAREGVGVLASPGRGVAAARNAGLRASRGRHVVFLDADDRLHPEYLAAVAAAFEADPAAAFVTSGVAGFGERVFRRPPPEKTDAEGVWAAAGALHGSTAFARRLVDELGPLDEALEGFDLEEFFLRMAAAGHHGVSLGAPFLEQRVREFGLRRYHLLPAPHRAAWRRIWERHREGALAQAASALAGRARALAGERARAERLAVDVASADRELRRLQDEVAELAAALRAAGDERVRWGDFRRAEPLSREWGRDRGTPLDRPYIESFLAEHAEDVRGAVLEVGDGAYTRRFGGGRVTRADVLDRDPRNPRANVVADLRGAPALAGDAYDCIVLTQVLQLVDDLRAAVRECLRLLRPGGVVLATVPAAAPYDAAAGEDHWRFTEEAARRLFAEAFPAAEVTARSYGNVLVDVAFLYGLAAEDLREAERAAHDPYFPLTIAVRARKPVGDGGRLAGA